MRKRYEPVHMSSELAAIALSLLPLTWLQIPSPQLQAAVVRYVLLNMALILCATDHFTLH